MSNSLDSRLQRLEATIPGVYSDTIKTIDELAQEVGKVDLELRKN